VNKRVKKFLDDLLIKYVNPIYKNNEIDNNIDTVNTENHTEEGELLRKSKTSVPIDKPIIKRSETDYIGNEKIDDEKIEGIIVEELKENEFLNMVKDMSLNTKQYDSLYNGYTTETNINRILMVTHGGVIMELNNIIYKFKGIEKFAKNESSNTGLTIIRIYCGTCGGKCKNLQNCKLEFDYILSNDEKHCKHLKE
jgi:hypothetical protein